MTEIEGLENKAFRFQIEWIVNSEYILEEGIEDYLEKLRETGHAVVKSVDLIDKIL